MLGRYLDIPIKLKNKNQKDTQTSVGYSLGGENEEEGGVDLDENIEMRLGEEGGDLTDGQQHHGGEEGRHHAAGQGPGL